MNDSLTSLLMKNIDLILEGFNVDEKGNLIEINKKKVAESDELFHNYFVKRMNHTFRQINEADPIMDPSMNMHPQHAMHGMHPMGMGMGAEGHAEQGLGGDEMMGDMAMDDMRGQGMHGHGMQMGDADPMGGDMGMGGGMAHGAPGMEHPMESAEGDEFDWVFNEDTDLDVDSLFDLNEWEDDEEKAEHEEDEDHEKLDEFMNDMNMQSGGADDMMGGGGSDFLPDGGMDQEGGHNDFGGDMGGAGMGSGEDMVTVHGTTDNGGEFEFSFDPETLGFEGGDTDDMGDTGGMGGEHHEEHEPHHSGQHDVPGMGDEEKDEMGEAAQHWHNGKPAKGKRGPKTSRMSIVPANPATKHTAPFPSPMGNRQKK